MRLDITLDVDMAHCGTNCGGTQVHAEDCCQEPCYEGTGCNVYFLEIDVWGDNYLPPNRISLHPGARLWYPAFNTFPPYNIFRMCNPNLPDTPTLSTHGAGVGGDCGWHNLSLHYPAGSEAYTIKVYYAARSASEWGGKALFYDPCLRDRIGTGVKKFQGRNYRINLSGGLGGGAYRIHGTSTWVTAGSISTNGPWTGRLNFGPGGPSYTPSCEENEDCGCLANGPYKDNVALHFLTDELPNSPSSSTTPSTSPSSTSPSNVYESDSSTSESSTSESSDSSTSSCALNVAGGVPVWIALCSCEADGSGFDADTQQLASFLTVQPSGASHGRFAAAWIPNSDYTSNMTSVSWGTKTGKIFIGKAKLTDLCLSTSRNGAPLNSTQCVFVYTRTSTGFFDEKWDLLTAYTNTSAQNDCEACLASLGSMCPTSSTSSTPSGSSTSSTPSGSSTSSSSPCCVIETTWQSGQVYYGLGHSLGKVVGNTVAGTLRGFKQKSDYGVLAIAANEPGVGVNWNTIWSECTLCPTSSSSSNSSFPSESSSSSRTITYNYYKAYPCGYWESSNCNLFWQIGGGVPTRVDSIYDTGSLISCDQSNGTSLQYKVSTINGLGTYPSICFLLIKQTSLGAFYTPTSIIGAHAGCIECTASSSETSTSSQASSSSAASSSSTTASSSLVPSSSTSSTLPSMSPSDRCDYFYPDKVEIKGDYKRDPEYNSNMWIAQGDSVCYRFKVFDHGTAIDLANYTVRAHIKLRMSDAGAMETFSTRAISDAGVNNVIELSLAASETTCLPINELVYDCEIENNITKEVNNVLMGYLNVIPEVTRDAEDCTASWSLLTTRPSATSSSSTSSSSAAGGAAYSNCECFSAYFKRVTNTADNTYTFTVEVPTHDVAMRGITHWQANLSIRNNGNTSLHESELVYNSIDPASTPAGYENIYPVGGSLYRFVDKSTLALGGIKTVFTVPVPSTNFETAQLQLRIFTPNCPAIGSEWLYLDFDPNVSVSYKTVCLASSSSSSSSS